MSTGLPFKPSNKYPAQRPLSRDTKPEIHWDSQWHPPQGLPFGPPAVQNQRCLACLRCSKMTTKNTKAHTTQKNLKEWPKLALGPLPTAPA